MSVILIVHSGVYLFMSVLDRLLTICFICMAIVSKSKKVICHIVALLKIAESIRLMKDLVDIVESTCIHLMVERQMRKLI